MMQIKKGRIFNRTGAALALLLPVLFFSCVKSKFEPVEHYPDPPPTLVRFLDGAPNPSIGTEGSEVTFKVNGLKDKKGQFQFFINQTEAEVLEVQEDAVKVKVPANASTGAAAVLINGEYYFGPTFTVRGKVSIDPLFKPDAYSANDAITGIIKGRGTDYLIFGSFTDYNNRATADKPITGIAAIDKNGAYAGTQLNMGKEGLNGKVSSVIVTPDSKYIVGGSFSKYDTVSNIYNIVRLNTDGTLETMDVDVINPDPVNYPNDSRATVPSFNGGTNGPITKMFYDDQGRVTVIGNFFGHISTFYERSTKSGPFLDRVKSTQLMRMNSDGSFDSTFNYNVAEEASYAGGNGFIYDGAMLSNGNLVLVGNFTSFSGAATGYITSINAEDGLPDAAFSAGSGADGPISKITYNENTQKLLLTGSFKHYNGQPANGVVMINEDGSIDPGFQFKVVEGGIPNFAGQLNDGKIIVSGSFTRYDNVVRPGLVILNADGTLASGYNNMGLFRGQINAFIETPPDNAGVPTVILVGAFDRFDNKAVGNIVKIRIQN